ncbi:hypothetical protein [Citricoccus sp. NR2]|uniref:hypothetical protein n=1 Tax=Citricoccus sp. NR2 TaxID=3004095 RepID=UPI0022DD52F0|nr:hypothetical protein [Citricoccus sp. NR2]WBL17982.1 hypothetical protein O1A05_09200 [Citricoccus sp. NR2]
MRWEALFADLEGELAAQRWQEIEATAAELTRGDRAQIALGQRLQAAVGTQVRVGLTGGGMMPMMLQSAAPEWLGGYDGAGSLIVTTRAIEMVDADLSRAAPPEEKPRVGASFAAACRSLSRRRELVAVTSVSGCMLAEGRIDLVGADYIEVTASLSVGGRRGSRLRRAIPMAAVQTVRAHRMAMD